MPSYYTYGDYYPSTYNNPSTGYWENPSDWPRTYQYTSAYNNYYQGFHPPAPVYQSNQPNPAAYYYGTTPGIAPGGYFHNGNYYATPQAPSGWPYTSPSSYSYICYPNYDKYSNCSTCPYSTNLCYQSCTAQYPYGYPSSAQFQNIAAAALAANAALAAQPNAPFMFVGRSQAEIDMQNAILAQAYGMPAMVNVQPGMPQQIVPFKPAAGQQFWCKELDGSWTLREQREVMDGSINPGHWEKHTTSGYFYWVRHTA